jgi:hypothetical protein
MMNSDRKDDQYSDEQAERRATEALRRALTTPYKPQREMVGKTKPNSRTRQSKAVEKRK